VKLLILVPDVFLKGKMYSTKPMQHSR